MWAVGGEHFTARLTGVTAAWQVTYLDANGKQQTVPAAELAWWGTCVEPTRGSLVVLADGGLVPADVTAADKDNLTAESDLLGTLKLPLESLAGVVFHLPADRHDRDLLVDRIARAAGETDRVLLDNGDEVTGLVESLAGGKIEIKADVGPIGIETRRCVALVLNPALRQKPTPAGFSAWVGLSDGGRMLAARLTVGETAAQWTTPAGQTFKTASKELVFLQPLGGRSQYLSDLQPVEYRHVPYLDLPWPYHADRNVTGGMLRCGGRLCLKGLGVHSGAHLTYALDGSAQVFHVELGIDDSTGGGGSVEFHILVDGDLRYVGEAVRGGAPPVSREINVAGAKRLELEVVYGARGDVLDRADWLNARLVRWPLEKREWRARRTP